MNVQYKKWLLGASFALGTVSISLAQDSVAVAVDTPAVTLAQPTTIFIVKEIKSVMSKGEQPGMEIFIREGQAANVEKAWASLMKKYKAKVSKAKGSVETFADNAAMTDVSENTVDIYSTVTTAENGSVIRIYADLGGGFVSSADYPQAFKALEAQLKIFAIEQVNAEVDNQIKGEEKTLSGLESDLKTLIKNKDSYHKEIEKNKQLIAQREQDIVKNKADQEVKQQQIKVQRDVVNNVKDKRNQMSGVSPDAIKIIDKQVSTEEKNLKSYEGELKKLQKELESYYKDIEKAKATIAQREQDIIKNEQDQKTKNEQIEVQKAAVEKVRVKKSQIK